MALYAATQWNPVAKQKRANHWATDEVCSRVKRFVTQRASSGSHPIADEPGRCWAGRAAGRLSSLDIELGKILTYVQSNKRLSHVVD